MRSSMLGSPAWVAFAREPIASVDPVSHAATPVLSSAVPLQANPVLERTPYPTLPPSPFLALHTPPGITGRLFPFPPRLALSRLPVCLSTLHVDNDQPSCAPTKGNTKPSAVRLVFSRWFCLKFLFYFYILILSFHLFPAVIVITAIIIPHILPPFPSPPRPQTRLSVSLPVCPSIHPPSQ
ncbi:hypothetical protein GGS23DRAFT_109585 [Durotheca rogersii]|uniref:uncharacterized protein n=1 Tax=Durotheca rogersii TaxID=419775 RepID=UPI00221E4088|nr:uncharacterized protein GGS23DRAFT_109585 [Durotheca rogersii]KAI5862179.1 hypothetical protein GGS23DRAFT_109585 [Durotheca rogersii]